MDDFFDFSNEMLCVANHRGYFVRLNQAWTTTLGWSLEELTKQPFIEFVHPDDVNATAREAKLLQSTKYETVEFVNRYRCKDGSYKWLAWKARARAESGEIIATARDVSQQREQTEALRLSEQRLRAIYQQAPLGIAILESRTGKFLQVNPKLEAILARAEEEILQLDFQTLTHFDDLQQNLDNMARLLNGEIRQFHMEKRFLRPDESIVWVELFVVPLWDDDEQPKCHLSLVEDISERKQAAVELKEQRSQIQGLLDNTPAVIYVKDRHGRHTVINQRFENLFRHRSEEVVGKTVFDLNPEPIARKMHEFDQQVWATGRTLVQEETLVHEHGPCTYRSVKFPIFDESGNMIALGGISTDITDLTKANEELKTQQKLLRSLIEVQEQERQFMCYEFHDGLIQYAAGSLMSLEAYRDSNSEACTDTPIDEVIVNLRKGVEEGRSVIRGIRPTVLDDMGLAAAIDDLIDQMSNSGIAFETDFDPRIDRLDQDLEATVYRVAQEALTNARKHGKPEHIAVRLRKVDRNLQLEVQDNGIGFNEAQISSSGFGLLGMRERVRLIGGNLRIESTPGFGTHVIVRFPISNHVEPEHVRAKSFNPHDTVAE